MENLDIYILTSIVVTLFGVFIIGTYRVIKNMNEDSYMIEGGIGSRVQMIKFISKVFDNKTIPKKEKKKLYKAMTETLADMECDGMYFSKEEKDKLKKQRDELSCEYSGLPSVKSYETKNIKQK